MWVLRVLENPKISPSVFPSLRTTGNPSQEPRQTRFIATKRENKTMTRESLNLTLTADLRKLEIKPRLNRLSTRTGLNTSLIAGRALTLGLSAIESDLTRMFPENAAPATEANATPKPEAVEPSSPVITSKAPQRTAKNHTTPQESASPRSIKPRLVSAEVAAHELGYRRKGTFIAHVFRHPELRETKHEEGQVVLWDLDRLRDLYQQHGWEPR